MDHGNYIVRPTSSTGRGSATQEQGSRLSPLQTVWHRRWIVAGVVVVCMLIAGLLAHFMPKVYTREAQIVVEPASRIAGEGGFNSDSYLNTQAELISKSAAIHVDALNFLADANNGAAGESLGSLRANLTATPGKNDNIITIAFSSRSSSHAADVVNALVNSYQSFTSSDNHKSNGDSIQSIEADKEKWEMKLHEQHTHLANLKGEISRLQTVETVGSDNSLGLKVIEDALANAQLESINDQSAFEEFAKANISDPAKLDKLLRTAEFNGMNITAGHDGEQIKSDLYQARRHLSDLNERLLPNHPAVQAAQAKVDDLTASLVLFFYQKWVSAANKVKTLQARVDQQQRAVAENAAKVSADLAQKTAEYDEIDKSLARTEKLTDLLSTRLQDMHSADRIGTVRISVVTKPDPETPVPPSKPNLPVMLFEGLMVGLILGVSVSLIDPRVRSVEEVMAATSLPIIGVIPHMKRSSSLQSRGRKVHLDPMSDVSEAYRAIRSAIFFGPKGKTVLITSPMRAEGKSTSAANLAIAMAEAGQRIILVDADLREPMQHRIFAISNDAGVSNVVTGRGSLDRAIQSSGIRGLDLLPCGPVPFNPSETINNQAFADMLATLAQRYDYVIVDSPPVMAVTDARILAAMCDLALLVIRAERSNKRAAQDARDGLLGFGGNLIGVIVNDGPRNRQRYGYYGGYGRTSGPITPAFTRATIERPQTMKSDLALLPKR